MRRKPGPRKGYLTLEQKAVAAMKAAIAGVIEEHKRYSHPLVVWRHGKVVEISPAEATAVNEEEERYDG